MKKVAIRETNKGYQLCELFIQKTNFGGYRKYAHDSSLSYKRLEFAKQKCLDFYKSFATFNSAYKIIEFYGVIGNTDFCGEEATEEEFLSFNQL
jgi:hypothetical protein